MMNCLGLQYFGGSALPNQLYKENSYLIQIQALLQFPPNKYFGLQHFGGSALPNQLQLFEVICVTLCLVQIKIQKL